MILKGTRQVHAVPLDLRASTCVSGGRNSSSRKELSSSERILTGADDG